MKGYSGVITVQAAHAYFYPLFLWHTCILIPMSHMTKALRTGEMCEGLCKQTASFPRQKSAKGRESLLLNSRLNQRNIQIAVAGA